MINLGSGNNGEFTLIDILNILDFMLEIQNYNMNSNQNDMQSIQSKFNDQISIVVNDIHKHLQEQDDKIDEILARLDNLNK